MKIIHCADIHLGSKMETHLSKENAKLRKEEIFDTFVNMISYANNNNINHIIIAGDLIDSKNVSNTLIKKVIQIINKFKDINFYYLEGNHDAHVIDLSNLPSNLYIFKDEFKRYDLDGVSIGGTTSNNIDQINFDSDKYNILILHGNVVKYNSNSEDDIYLPKYNGLNINYFALGHIHKNEIIKIDNNSFAVYSGCLEGRGFDEIGNKGFYILDIENNNLKLEFKEIAKRILEDVYVDITGVYDNDEIYVKIEEKLVDKSKNNLYKIILTGYYDLQLIKNIEKIQNILNEKYYYLKIVDNSKLKIDYKDYENDISLIGEFVRTVLDNNDLLDSEKNKILEYGIKALKNEEI